MLKLGGLVILLAFILTVLGGCSTGEVSKSDVQKSAKAQADYVKEHPDPPGAGAGG